ncbi:jg16167 [Pararge aegeria aegeria]|uniref:Jg16167 protein n=1 Tax=Pararge aegeria aegeria TaxID=348720 RepID=A0A8S4RFZ5_9NEOP|nr:jg16167 [Pararge aegeria aegeria]
MLDSKKQAKAYKSKNKRSIIDLFLEQTLGGGKRRRGRPKATCGLWERKYRLQTYLGYLTRLSLQLGIGLDGKSSQPYAPPAVGGLKEEEEECSKSLP